MMIQEAFQYPTRLGRTAYPVVRLFFILNFSESGQRLIAA